MATTPIPIPNLKPSIVNHSPKIPCSISFPKTPFHVCSSNHFRSLSSFSSPSVNNGNDKPNSKQMNSGYYLKEQLLRSLDDLLSIEEINKLMSHAADEYAKLKNDSQKLAEREAEIKKMKETINQLQTRASQSQIEKCREKLLEIKAVVEEAERSLFKL